MKITHLKRVTKIKHDSNRFDIQVANTSNFFANNILVHNSFTGVGILPRELWDEKHFLGRFVVFSKGLGSKGLCFKDNEANTNNLYVRTLLKFDIFEKLGALMESMEEENGFDVPMFLLGETFGPGVQDLSYGKETRFRLFDVCVGFRGEQSFFGYEARKFLADHLGIDMVPVLYKGPYSAEVVTQYTNGKETVSGKEQHIREGIVITPAEERDEEGLGRLILKSVSEHYLLRSGDATEYQ